MDSKNIYEETTKRAITLGGGIILFSIAPKEQKAENFKRALFDYTCEKLLETDENQIIVEEIGLVFERLDKQFITQKEKDDFYSNYVYCVLSQYGALMEKQYKWDKRDNYEEGEYPRIENDKLISTLAYSNEETAIWLFRQFDKELQKSSGNYQKRKK